MPDEFAGFSLGLLHFLEELSRNNNRKWFEANRDRYERELREPALAYIAAMERPIQKISPHFTAVPKKMGGSLMRIHRDVRFSNNKQPYKTNVGIQFRHEAGKDVHAPGFYFHVDTEGVFVAAGVWHPDSESLKAIRDTMDEYPTDWKRARDAKAFRERFELAGDSLKRPPRGYGIDHPLLDDLKRKDHIAVANLDHDVLFDKSLVKLTADYFRVTRKYMQFLCEAVGVDF
ncbi:DUF2461 domain-containing protein [Aeoliella sp.]|uniref:DUF2461 domain-containing protein n=1 Tax=Aeoliella sp. TaxID=2795800 RepID=UPI003CCBF51F